MITGENAGLENAAVDEKSDGGHETILLVEDEVQVRRMFSQVLKRKGYTVIEAVDGRDAVKKFEENAAGISLIICDLVMPGMDGIRTMTQIRQIRKDIPCQFVSGYAPDSIKQNELTGLQTDVLSKPVSKNVLLRKIRDILDQPKDVGVIGKT